jgi:hypothetical protein
MVRVACRLIRILRGTLGSLQFLHVVRRQLRRIEPLCGDATALRSDATTLRRDATALRPDATALRPDAAALRTSTDRSRL